MSISSRDREQTRAERSRTSSDIVRFWRAASRLSWAMTVSSILSVVFIWKTMYLTCTSNIANRIFS